MLGLVLARGRQDNAMALQQDLIVRSGGVAGVLAADRAELARLIGPEAVFDLKLLRHAASRMAIAGLAKRDLLTSFSQVAAYLKSLLTGRPREEFWVLFLNRKNQLLASERLGVAPSIMRRSIRARCCAAP